jgi:predicted O-methyltransferase YrrM
MSMDMSGRIPLFTSLPPNLTRRAAGHDVGASYLAECMASWRHAGFAPISLNSTNEVRALAERGYQVEYRTVSDDRPKIRDFLREIRNSGMPLAGIINADVLLSNDTAAVQRVLRHARDGIVAIERTNIDPLRLKPTNDTCFGFDCFILNTEPLAQIDLDVDYAIGHPWWDYWLPLEYVSAGCKLTIAADSLLFHLDHPVRWTPELFHRNGGEFIDYFLTLPGRIPGDVLIEIQRCNDPAISESELVRFGQWFFHRLRRLAEFVPAGASNNDAALLSALAAIVPDHELFGDIKRIRAQLASLAGAGPGVPAPSAIMQANRGASLADRLEHAGDALAGRAPASLLYRAAAQLDLSDVELQACWGGPFNGQAGRQQLFHDLVTRLQFDAVIETGTHRGITAEWIARNFNLDLYTCEIKPRLFHQSEARLAGIANAHIECADSVAFLTKLSATSWRRRNILIYLDAHWMDDLPLPDELAVIRRRFKRAVVMIDDFEMPTDSGYGFDTCGPGKRVGLALLRPLRDRCFIFLPTLPSTIETGERRGAAVLTWNRKLGRQLMGVPGLRLATGADWAAAFDETGEKPLASASESPTNRYEGHIDVVNGARPDQFGAAMSETLWLQGWLAICAKQGVLPDAVFVTLLDHHGKKIYFRARPMKRPDVMEYFNHSNMLHAGFEIREHIGKHPGDFFLGLSLLHDGKLASCEGLGFPVSIGHRRRPRVLLIKRWGSGFWSDVDHVVGQLAASEILGRVPVVQWGAAGPYGDGRDETFTRYFEPVSDMTIADLAGGTMWPRVWGERNIDDQLPFEPARQIDASYRSYEFSREKRRLRPEDYCTFHDMLGREEDVVVSIVWESPADIAAMASPSSRFHAMGADEVRRAIVTERLRLRTAISEKIDRFWHEHLAGHATLAVHVRGSDKIVENKMIHEQNALALQIAREWSGRIFLLTDSERYLAQWAQLVGERLVFQECLRTHREDIPNFFLPDSNGYRNGEEILIDTYVAARCDRFVGTYSSNVGKYVLALGGHTADRVTFVDRLARHAAYCLSNNRN